MQERYQLDGWTDFDDFLLQQKEVEAIDMEEESDSIGNGDDTQILDLPGPGDIVDGRRKQIGYIK